jgi:hypothetical protein
MSARGKSPTEILEYWWKGMGYTNRARFRNAMLFMLMSLAMIGIAAFTISKMDGEETLAPEFYPWAKIGAILVGAIMVTLIINNIALYMGNYRWEDHGGWHAKLITITRCGIHISILSMVVGVVLSFVLGPSTTMMVICVAPLALVTWILLPFCHYVFGNMW